MITTLICPAIKSVYFNETNIVVNLNNDRVFIIPLEKFPSIKNLSSEEKKSFEIIDDKYLSFLSIDDIFSLEELIGLSHED